MTMFEGGYNMKTKHFCSIISRVGSATRRDTLRTYNKNQLPKKRRSLVHMLLVGVLVLSMNILLYGCSTASKEYSASKQIQENGIPTTEITPHTTMLTNTTESDDFSLITDFINSNYFAMQEWKAFEDSYDKDRSLLKANDNNESGIPDDYLYIYGCYTWDMVNKVDTLLNQFDLQLLTNLKVVQADEDPSLLQQLNIDGILRNETDIEYLGGYFYKEGTFSISSCFQLTHADATWKHPIIATYRYSIKEYFDPAYPSIDNLQGYTQWEHILSDGTKVLLALNDEHAVILCNRNNAIITVEMSSNYSQNSDERINQTVLEQIAEVLDFSVTPQINHATTEQEKNAPADNYALKNAFSECISQYLDTSYYPIEPMYLFSDLNNDNAAELIIRNTHEDGTPYLDIYSEKNGCVFQMNLVLINYICNGNIVEEYSTKEGREKHLFYKVGSDGLVLIDSLEYDPTLRQWTWAKDASWGISSTVISEAEALSMISDYARIDLQMTPCSWICI